MGGNKKGRYSVHPRRRQQLDPRGRQHGVTAPMGKGEASRNSEVSSFVQIYGGVSGLETAAVTPHA